MSDEYPFVVACQNAKVKKRNKHYSVNPYKSLYTLAEVSALTIYSLQTLRHYAYGFLKNNSPFTILKTKSGSYCVKRPELIDYFNDLEIAVPRQNIINNFHTYNKKIFSENVNENDLQDYK